MCVICINPKGKGFPSKKNIQNCADANPDGFAIMWNEDGIVKNYKTLKKDEFMKFYEKFVKEHDHKTTACVIHARIKTHGSLKLSNCHCWTALENQIGFAHNGILSIANRGDLTDSETYFRDIFLPVFEWSHHNWAVAEKTVDAIIGTSKFAFLTGDGEIHKYGHYIKHQGSLYSNSSYEDRVYYTSSRYSGIGYKGKWNANKWAADYYADKDYMFLNGARIDKHDITDKRWKLMCNYYHGMMTETEYCSAVVLSDREPKGTLEWWLDEGEYPVSEGYTSYSQFFLDKKEWELYVMNKLGKLTNAAYAKASSCGFSTDYDWDDEKYIMGYVD